MIKRRLSCPKCGGDVRVIDTRHPRRKGDPVILTRRRKCQRCPFRWTTVEIPIELFRKLRKVHKVYAIVVALMREEQRMSEQSHCTDGYSCPVCGCPETQTKTHGWRRCVNCGYEDAEDQFTNLLKQEADRIYAEEEDHAMS